MSKELIEHIARRHWEYGQGGQWDVPEGVNPADQPFPAYASEQNKREYRAYAAQLLAGAPPRPCPICGTNCSGCLEDLAAKQEGLRELLSYCETQADVTSAQCPGCNEPENAYRDVAQKLAPLLDGEA